MQLHLGAHSPSQGQTHSPLSPKHTQRPATLSDCPLSKNRGLGVEGLGRACKSAEKYIYVSPNDTVTNHAKERDSISCILNHGHGDCAINFHLPSFLCRRAILVSDQPPALTPPAPQLSFNQTLINLFCLFHTSCLGKGPICRVCSSVQTFNAFDILWFHVIDLASQVPCGRRLFEKAARGVG